MGYKRWCRTCSHLDKDSICGKLGIKRDEDAQECPSENRSCKWTARSKTQGQLEAEQINAAIKKKLTMGSGKPVDKLLGLVLLVDTHAGKILDVVSKPLKPNEDVTGYPQLKGIGREVRKAVEEAGYKIVPK